MKNRLKRGKPLQRGPWRSKKKPAFPSKPKRERYPDCTGLCFHEVFGKLAGDSSEWRPGKPIRSPEPRDIMYDRFGLWNECWICGNVGANGSQVHHIASGGRKSDELTNLIMVGHPFDCPCHDEVQSNRDRLKDCFRAKWNYDRWTLTWVRLVLLVGRWPDFKTLD